jgi:hypothetical protein
VSTTCQTIIDRAKQYSPLNTSLATDPVEMLTRIQQMQQRVFTAVAALRRPPFTTTASVTSNSAASARSISVASLSPPLERLLRVTLPSGAEVYPVSEFDQQAQLAPRYFARQKTLIEVASDWGATGTVALTLLYAYGATAIAPTGAATQAVTVPDEWIDLLIKPLAMYFHTKDPGRDPSEYQTLDAEYGAVWNGFLGYVANYSGDVTRRELLPAPPESQKR